MSRFHYMYTFRMNKCVTHRMQHNQIGEAVAPSIDSPYDVMNLPLGIRCNPLITYGASAPLLKPDLNELFPSLQFVPHFVCTTLLKVHLPLRIERISCNFNRFKPVDRRIDCFPQICILRLTVGKEFSGSRGERPVSGTLLMEISFPNPLHAVSAG